MHRRFTLFQENIANAIQYRCTEMCKHSCQGCDRSQSPNTCDTAIFKKNAEY